MKKLLAIVSLCLATNASAQLTEEELLALRILLAPQDQYYVQPQPQQLYHKMDAIYEAYPGNPGLYRYLERNPRHIDYYLGR